MFKTSDKSKIQTDFEISTLIAEGIVIEGDLLGKDSIRIDGRLKGDIRMDKGVVIGECGFVAGHISCESMIVFGRIEGNVSCKNLYIKSSGVLTGNIIVELFSIDLGGKLNGMVEMSSPHVQMLLEEKTPG